MPARYDYDLIILGGGAAGIVAGVVAGSAGLRTLLIDRRRVGGECLETGSVPSKALLHAARVAHLARTADRVGLRSFPVSREDGAGVLRHVRETIRRVEEADAATQLLQDAGVEIRLGDAAFISGDALELRELGGPARSLRAEHYLIATGSGPARPPVPGLEEIGYLTNEEVYGLEAIPESLLVVGGGPIGTELAQAFQRLGCQVTLVGRAPRVLPRDDPEATEVLEAALRADGVTLRLGATAVAVRRDGARKAVEIEQEGAREEMSAEEILVAVGRTPHLNGLNLAAAGVELAAGGPRALATLRTTNPRVWACGDVTGRYQFAHMAEHEARLVLRGILFPFDHEADPGSELSPWATFTDPEVARAGLSESEARARNQDYQVYRQEFAQNDRALTDGEGLGFVKVLAAGWQGKILGVQIVGPRAGELVQEWIMAMTHGLTLRQVADTIHVYPTLSMANQHAASRWYQAQLENPTVRNALHAYAQQIRPNLGPIAWGAAGVGALAAAALLAGALRRKQ